MLHSLLLGAGCLLADADVPDTTPVELDGLQSLLALLSFGLFVLLAFSPVIAFRFLKMFADRQQVAAQLAAHGWTLTSIRILWFGGFLMGSKGRHYEVTYQTHGGANVIARCTINWWRGIQWVSDGPPGPGW